MIAVRTRTVRCIWRFALGRRPPTDPTMKSLRSIHPLTAAATAFAALLGLLVAGPAHARKSSGAIASPKSNQTVKGMLKIRPRVTAKSGPYVISIYIDGRLYDRQGATTRDIARSGVPIDTTELKNGRHSLKVKVQSQARPRFVKQTISFRVANRRPGPAGAGQRAPRRSDGRYNILVSENFTRSAPTGSFDPDSKDWGEPVYTGKSGTPWVAYPSSFRDTFLKHPYRAKQVLSVHNGVLDYHLRPVDGLTAGASLSPILPNGTQYQTYGRWSVRMRISNTSMPLYHAVFLLWPENDHDYEFSESDFPEAPLDAGRQWVMGYSHFGMYGEQEAVNGGLIDLREWHTFTQEWTPSMRRFYLDGRRVHTTRHLTWSGPMRWEMQIQTYRNNGDQSGHLYVDWAAVWGWSPKAGKRRVAR